MTEILEKPLIKRQSVRQRAENILRQMYDATCQALEEIDGKKFCEQTWKHDKNGTWVPGENSEGNVYSDRALRNGNVFEKVGVNYVSMEGELPPGMSFQGSEVVMTVPENGNNGKKGLPFFATSTSFVIHPHNPMTPTAHVNYRYFQLGDGTQPDSWWFGGGGDLTPNYLFEEDALHFHQVHKEACDKHDLDFYPRFKKWCDSYFYLPHRAECRGVGGIFFDYLKDRSAEELLLFVQTCAEAFVPAYLPIVERRKDMDFTQENKDWQRLRRGRYAEFILLNDKGTRFGLATNIVHTQSVLNCMPGEAFWNYDDQPAAGSKEAAIAEVLKSPRDWL